MKYKIKLIDGKHAGMYFVSGDFEDYKVTEIFEQATEFSEFMDTYGNMMALYDMHGIKSIFVFDDSDNPEQGKNDGRHREFSEKR